MKVTLHWLPVTHGRLKMSLLQTDYSRLVKHRRARRVGDDDICGPADCVNYGMKLGGPLESGVGDEAVQITLIQPAESPTRTQPERA